MTGRTPSDLEMPARVTNLDAQSHIYDTVSVLDAYAGDLGVFFRPAQAVSGVLEATIETTYDKLATGCLTWVKEGVAVAPEHLAAAEYERGFVKFQVLTENCVYEVAKHLVRYRAIFLKAGEDIAALMTALTEKFANPPVEGAGGGADFDLKSIVITGIATALTTVLGGGVTAPVVLATAAVDTLGEAVKTAQSTRRELHVHPYFHDTAKQYIDGVNRIEREVADAVRGLADNMRVEVDRLRDLRRYALWSGGEATETQVPRIGRYLDSLRK